MAGLWYQKFPGQRRARKVTEISTDFGHYPQKYDPESRENITFLFKRWQDYVHCVTTKGPEPRDRGLIVRARRVEFYLAPLYQRVESGTKASSCTCVVGRRAIQLSPGQ